MSQVNESSQIDIDLKMREAEVYLSQGLFSESLQIYKGILSDFNDIEPNTKEDISEKIQLLLKKIEEIEQDDPMLSTQDITTLKETWTSDANIDEILSSASSFRELGLCKNAVEEYTRLFDFGHPVDEIMSDLVECLFEFHSPSKAIEQVEKITDEKKLSDQDKAKAYFMLGTALEKKDHKDLALEVYESAKKLDPTHKGLEAKIKSLQDRRVYDSRYGYLLESKIITTSQLQNALTLAKKSNKSVEWVLMEQNRVQKEDIGKSLSLYYNCPFMTFEHNIPVPFELLGKLKKSFLIKNSWVPLSWEMSTRAVDVLIDDPGDLTKTDSIAILMKTHNINFSVGIKEDISKIIGMFYDQRSGIATKSQEDTDDGFNMMEELDIIEFEDEEDEFVEDLEDFDEASSQIVRMVDQILISAYRSDVSDIHIEPSPHSGKAGIRFRIDGVCQDFLQVPIKNARAILSRIKIMSGLDIAERRLPQDGKIKFRKRGIKTFELRVATLPTVGGYEDAVLRILAEFGAMKLDDMGLSERNVTIIKKVISQPYGLFLVVGPTGSGKTTTLHSALGHINKPGIKIWTAEDPVEITQPGLRQVQCKFKIGLNFARVMRAFLRADPDVIMIGEMRDEETASIGVEASLTGHLVFSTLHTNSAPETITRLLDMGLNPLNFSDAFLAVLAQRLARRLCKKCRKEYHPTQEEIDVIRSIYGKEDFDASGIELTTKSALYRAEGCDDCHGTGYKGRFGIHELMEGSKEIKRMIKNEATSEELFIQAAKDGMTTLVQDGLTKALSGLTDITEIRRVCVS